jgi:pantoate kinase
MSVTAFAPGSVTTVFVPQDGDASLGVSFATADGVTATVEPASATTVFLDGRRTEVEPVSRVLRRLDAAATVRLESDLPIGCGFGVSGAATLATALAANAEMQLGYERDALLEAAHRAEVAAGTGLGDVFIQNRGGLVWDVGNGLQHSERTARIEYASYGEIATADVLGDEAAMGRVVEVGERVLDSIEPDGAMATLFNRSWTFASRVEFPTDRVRDAVEQVQDAGGVATMAMIGETVVATGTDGVLNHETRIASSGATVR